MYTKRVENAKEESRERRERGWSSITTFYYISIPFLGHERNSEISRVRVRVPGSNDRCISRERSCKREKRRIEKRGWNWNECVLNAITREKKAKEWEALFSASEGKVVVVAYGVLLAGENCASVKFQFKRSCIFLNRVPFSTRGPSGGHRHTRLYKSIGEKILRHYWTRIFLFP